MFSFRLREMMSGMTMVFLPLRINALFCFGGFFHMLWSDATSIMRFLFFWFCGGRCCRLF